MIQQMEEVGAAYALTIKGIDDPYSESENKN